MASSDKPVVLIIGGGWHKPFHYDKLRLALESAGHEVFCPELPSTDGARPPTGGLMRDAKCVRAATEDLINAGRHVVAISHSYGGQLASQALYGLGAEARKAESKVGGVVHLIYMCAFMLPEGMSMYAKVEEMGQGGIMEIAFKYGDDRSVLCSDPHLQLISEGGDESEVKKYLGSFNTWNGWCIEDCIGKCAWRDIPTSYIKTLNDNTVPENYQTTMIELVEKEKGVKVPTYEIFSGHCPNLTATEDVAKAVNAIIAEL